MRRADSRGRPLRPIERDVIEAMLNKKWPKSELDLKLTSCLVEDMQDGGMGSILFLTPSPRKRRCGEALAEAQYRDEDGVLVFVVINADDQGELYEVDFWKVDFSALRRYPTVSDLEMQT